MRVCNLFDSVRTLLSLVWPDFPQLWKFNSKYLVINCVLLHEFSLFYPILAFSAIFPTFSLKNSTISKNALVTLAVTQKIWSHCCRWPSASPYYMIMRQFDGTTNPVRFLKGVPRPKFSWIIDVFEAFFFGLFTIEFDFITVGLCFDDNMLSH